MQQWIDDEGRSLLNLLFDDPHRQLAETLTLEVLKQLGPSEKRSGLETLHRSELLAKASPVINLSHADFSGAALAGSNLRSAKLDYFCLKDADLTDAVFGHTIQRDAHTIRLARKDVFGEAFSNPVEEPIAAYSLVGVDLSGTVLKDAVLRRGHCQKSPQIREKSPHK
jgi:hypothetical protein